MRTHHASGAGRSTLGAIVVRCRSGLPRRRYAGRRPLARIAGEAGFVLPASVAVLLVITLLGAAAVGVSVSTSSSTTRDEHSKAALEAAEAGLRVATYRLNVLGPASEECLAGTTTLISKPTSEATQCQSSEEALGNGGSYQYWTTTELKKGGGCVGIIMTDAELERAKGEGVEQRCIASLGTVNGIKARVEARVSSFTARPVFPIAAMIAREKLIMEGNSSLKGAVASNGKIISKGSASQEGGCVLGPSGSVEGSTCEAVSQRTAEEGKFVVAAIQPGTSAKPALAPQKCEEQAEPKYNCNFMIENGIYNAEAGKEAKTPADGISSTGKGKVQVQYEPTHREMSMTTGSWTLNGYLYNFCNFNATGNSTISVNPGIKAVIFIEAPESEEPGSGCPAGSGKFEFSGTVNNPSGNPTALQIYVYGKGPVTYTGNANTSFVLDAPNSSVKLTGNGTITGGVIGNEITTSGSFSFVWDKEVEKLKAGPAGATTSYYRTAWAQCTPSATTPMGGC